MKFPVGEAVASIGINEGSHFGCDSLRVASFISFGAPICLCNSLCVQYNAFEVQNNSSSVEQRIPTDSFLDVKDIFIC